MGDPSASLDPGSIMGNRHMEIIFNRSWYGETGWHQGHKGFYMCCDYHNHTVYIHLFFATSTEAIRGDLSAFPKKEHGDFQGRL